MTESEEAQRPHPWQRYGWVMGAVWLVFLAFPVIGVLTSDEPRAQVVGALVAFVLFAGVYVHGLVRINTTRPDSARVGAGHLVVMVALLLVVHALVGQYSLGGGTYVVALAMFVLPLRPAVVIAVAAAVVTAAVTLASGSFGDSWFLTGIVVIVGILTGVVRLVEERAADHDQLENELRLTAERDRLARDVHDVIGHTLTAMSLKADVAERLVTTDPERARREIAEVGVLSRQALAEIRATVGGLRSARLGDEITSAQRVLASADIIGHLPDDVTVVDPRHRVVLAWVLREAVTNVVRHSEATVCRVVLGPSSLTVEDNGRGPGGLREGNGLRGVRERVDAAGGRVEVSEASPGTRVEVTL